MTKGAATSGRGAAGGRSGTRTGAQEVPDWLTPEAREEIAQAAAEWNAGLPAQAPEACQEHSLSVAVDVIRAIHAGGGRTLTKEEVEIWVEPMNLGAPVPWPKNIGKGRPRWYEGKDQYAHHSWKADAARKAYGIKLTIRNQKNRTARLGKFAWVPEAEIRAYAASAVARGTPKRRAVAEILYMLKRLPGNHGGYGWALACRNPSNVWRVLKRLGFVPWPVPPISRR